MSAFSQVEGSSLCFCYWYSFSPALECIIWRTYAMEQLGLRLYIYLVPTRWAVCFPIFGFCCCLWEGYVHSQLSPIPIKAVSGLQMNGNNLLIWRKYSFLGSQRLIKCKRVRVWGTERLNLWQVQDLNAVLVWGGCVEIASVPSY